MLLQRNVFIYLLLFSSLIFIDQFSKYKIRTLGGFYICNHNLAFSLSPYWTIVVLGSFIIALFIIKLQDTRHENPVNFKLQHSIAKLFAYLKIDNGHLFEGLCFVSWLLILSGAISNIIDRFYLGCVTDFIDLPFWPVFNLADIYIVIGAIAIMSNILLKKNDL